MPKYTERLEIRLPPDGKKAVLEEAEIEQRTVGDTVRLLLSEAIRARKARRK